MIDWDLLVLGPCMAVFGEPVSYTPATGNPFPIRGVFDEAYMELTPLPGGGMTEPSFISTTLPVLGVQLSQFPSEPKQGDILMARGTNYWVREVRPDGHGSAKLMLNFVEGQM